MQGSLATSLLWLKIRTWMLTGASLLVAIHVGKSLGETGGNAITYVIKVAGGLCCVAAFLNPALGLHLLVAVSGYLDLVKRLAYAAGSFGGGDLMAILQIAPVLFGCICLGLLLSAMVRGMPMYRGDLLIAAIVGVALVGILAANALATKSAMGTLALSANQGAYIPLLLVTGLLLRQEQAILRFLRFACLCYVPVALYGIYQGIFGLSDFEKAYLESGLTITITQLYDVRPRPFSTLNSPHAFSVMMAAAMVVSCHLTRWNNQRQDPIRTLAWLLLALIFTLACVLSFARVAWAFMVFGLVGMFSFHKAGRTAAVYVSCLSGFLLMVLNAEKLLEWLPAIQDKMPSGAWWQEQAFRVGTYSDRLVSFRNTLTNPALHTWFGRRGVGPSISRKEHDETLVHDLLSQLLSNYGFVGLGLCVALGCFALLMAHRKVLRIADPAARALGAALLAVLFGFIITSLFAGSHFTVFPLNLFFWLFAGALLALLRSRRQPSPPWGTNSHRSAKYPQKWTSPTGSSV